MPFLTFLESIMYMILISIDVVFPHLLLIPQTFIDPFLPIDGQKSVHGKFKKILKLTGIRKDCFAVKEFDKLFGKTSSINLNCIGQYFCIKIGENTFYSMI